LVPTPDAIRWKKPDGLRRLLGFFRDKSGISPTYRTSVIPANAGIHFAFRRSKMD